MNSQPKIYLTRSQLLAYEKQLNYMEGEGKRKLASLLASSPGSGMGRPLDLPIHDLARQFYYEIDQIIFKIKYSVIIEDLIESYDDLTEVNIGATVSFKDLDSEEIDKFVILGPDQTDPEYGVISYQSPFGAAIIGKREGDHFKINKTGIEYEIIKVEYLPINTTPKIIDWKSILDNTLI